MRKPRSLFPRLPLAVRLAAVATVIPLLAAPAAGAVEPTPSPDPTGSSAITAQWNGPAVHLDWRGNQTNTAEATFIGARVMVPGDHITRTLTITNAADQPATLAVAIEPEAAIPPEAVNPHLGDDVLIGWDIGDQSGGMWFTDLLDPDADFNPIATVPLEAGESIPVVITVSMDEDVSGHNRNNNPSTELSFKVTATISPQAPTVPTTPTEPTIPPTGPTTPTGPAPSGPSNPAATPTGSSPVSVDPTSPALTSPAPAPSETTSGPTPTGALPTEPSDLPTPTDTRPEPVTPDPVAPAPGGVLAKTGTSLAMAVVAVTLLAASAVVVVKRRYPSSE